jgi:hypothetical protein
MRELERLIEEEAQGEPEQPEEAPPSDEKPPRESRWPAYAEAILPFLVLIAVLLHPTQVTVRQWADAAARAAGFGSRLAAVVPSLGVCVSDLLLVAAFGLWVVARLRDGTLVDRLRRYPPALAFVLVCAVLSALPFLKPAGSAGAGEFSYGAAAREFIQLFMQIGCAYIVLADYLSRPVWRRRLVGAFVLAALVAVTAGVWEYSRLRPSAEPGAAASTIASPVDVDGTFGFRGEAAGAHEKVGTLSNRSVLGAWASIVLPLLWGLALFTERPSVRGVCGVVAVGGMVLLLQGGLWVAALVGLLVVGFLRGGRAFALTACVIFVLWAAVFRLAPQEHGAVLVDSLMLRKSFDRFRTLPVYGGDGALPSQAPMVLSDDDSSVWQQKYVEWQPGLLALARSPLLGVGFGNYQRHVNAFYAPKDDRVHNPDGVYQILKPSANLMETGANSFLLVWVTETGLLGLFALSWVVLSSLRSAAAGRTEAGEPFVRGLKVGATGSLCALVIGSLFAGYLVRGVGIALIFVLAAAACAPGAAPEAGPEAEAS